MSGLAAVLIGGPPATGKSTLAMALAPRMDAALLDLDTATGPLTRVVSELAGVPDLDDPVLAGLTRAARYDTLVGLAEANLAAGRPVVLVAPFSAERARPSAWAAVTGRLPAEATMVWLHLPAAELIRRLAARALGRDESKLRDPAAYLAGLDLGPPVIPHLALDASEPAEVLVRAVLERLSLLALPSLTAAVSGHRFVSAAITGELLSQQGKLHVAIDGTIGQNQGVPSMAQLETEMPKPPVTRSFWYPLRGRAAA